MSMQTRKQARLAKSPAAFQNLLETLHEPKAGETCGSGQPQNTTLSDASRKDVDKLLERVGERRALVEKKQENSSHYLGRKKQKSAIQGENPLFYQGRSSETKFHTLPSCGVLAKTKLDSEPTAKGNDENHTKHAAAKRHENQETITELEEYVDDKDFDWEEGKCMSSVGIGQSHPRQWSGEVTIEVEDEDAYNQGRKQSVRRATARDKEFAELVHKVHLLCLIGRGMLIDSACNDPLIQACLYSLIPSKLLNLGKEQKLTANVLQTFVEWFQNAFHIRSPEEGSSDPDERVTVVTKLCHAIERRGATNEEVAALSVALLRVLGLTTRYVSVLDVTPLKPDAESLEASADWNSDSDSENGGSLLHMNATKTTIASLGQVLARCPSQGSTQNMTFTDQGPGLVKRGRYNKRGSDNRNSVPDKITAETTVPQLQPAIGGKETVTQNEISEVIDSKDKDKMVKRKGDLEFEMQLAMALAATAAEAPGDTKSDSNVALNGLDKSAYSDMSASTSKRHQNKRPRILAREKHPAVWSRKQAPSLHWAEVYCEGETSTGRWVHVDAANGVIDGEHKVTEAVSSCRRPLRYVLAFAGNGAKDVTHRYVTQWSAIVPQRVSSPWWKSTLAPLKELEAAATAEISNIGTSKEDALHTSVRTETSVPPKSHHGWSKQKSESQGLRNFDSTQAWDNLSQSHACGSSGGRENVIDRSSLEDMELETRIFTEPLPTNQQAYKNHHLYVLERWLTKYQTLHPKGPVLGYCAGQPVYPRTSVQILHTAERWLREGLQIKKGEAPVKILKPSQNRTRCCPSEAQYLEEDCFQGRAIELFGKWQTEPLQLPPAMDGIVPKNERGHVDMWSEKCLPPGTVHLRLPRLVPIAKKLGIDFAPAMIGFEIHNGRSVPIFEGIVVCKEFRKAILQAYSEEEGRRAIEEKRRNEHEALSRWNQLLRSIAIRQRLQSDYGEAYSNSGQLSVTSTNENMRCVGGTNTHAAKNTKMARDDTVQESDVHEHTHSLEQPNDDLTNTEENIGKHEPISARNHIHVYPEENRSYDEENDTWTKRCPCGFSIQVEEM